MKARKKPVVIDFIIWTGTNLREVINFTDGDEGKPREYHGGATLPQSLKSRNTWGMKWEEYEDLVAIDGLKIYTEEGKMLANIGDYIIKGVKGEHYPIKPDIFLMTYDILT